MDVLRGFALAGVLLVNLFESNTIAPGADESWIGHAVNFFAEGSFYPLFSLLFGLGFALQMARFQMAGQRFAFFHVRRSLALIAIGVASFVLILGNPILIRYGSLALLLLVFGNASARKILIASVVTLLVVLGQGPVRQAWADHRRANPITAAKLAIGAAATRVEATAFRTRTDRAMSAGSYGDIVAVRWLAVRRMMRDPWFYAGSRNLSMFMLFLLGLFAARVGIMTRPTVDRDVLLKIALGGFALGVTGNVLLLVLPTLFRDGSPSMQRWTRDVVYYVANPALGLAYGAALMRLSETSALWRKLGSLAWVGRMALTNFLLQFVFMLFLFSLQRMRVIEHTAAWAAIVLSAVIFAGQIVLSRWWLSRFRHGPVEWLWRVLAFGKVRRSAGVEPLVDAPA